MYMPVTFKMVFAAEISLKFERNFGGLLTGGILRNSFSDMQVTEAPVSYNHVP